MKKEIKISYKNEIKRFEIPPTFKELRDMILKCFKQLKDTEFQVTYLDDEQDNVVISNEFDLEQVFMFMEKQKVTLLRAFLEISKDFDAKVDEVDNRKSFNTSVQIGSSIEEKPSDLELKIEEIPKTIKIEEKVPEIKIEEKVPEIKMEEKAPEIKMEEKVPELKIEEKVPEIKIEEKVPEIKIEEKPAEAKKEDIIIDSNLEASEEKKILNEYIENKINIPEEKKDCAEPDKIIKKDSKNAPKEEKEKKVLKEKNVHKEEKVPKEKKEKKEEKVAKEEKVPKEKKEKKVHEEKKEAQEPKKEKKEAKEPKKEKKKDNKESIKELIENQNEELKSFLTDLIEKKFAKLKTNLISETIKKNSTLLEKTMVSFQQLSLKAHSENNNTVVHNVSCKGCEAPEIQGIRYKCSICSDFDFCEHCEDKLALAHNHPFLKIRIPFPEKDIQHLKKENEMIIHKEVVKPILSSNCTSDNFAEFDQGQADLKVTVLIENDGNMDWSEDTVLKNIHGIFGDKIRIGQVVRPADKCYIPVSFTTKNLKAGEYTSRWQLFDGNDAGFGKYIDIKFKVIGKKDEKKIDIKSNNNEPKTVYRFYNKLNSMKDSYYLKDVPNEKILEALEQANGNM